MTRFLIIISILYFVLAFYGYQGIRTLFKTNWIHFIFIGLFILVWVYFLIKVLGFEPGSAMSPSVAIAGGVFFSFFILGLLSGIILLLEDVVRLVTWGAKAIMGQANTDTSYFPTRRKFVSAIALGLAALPFGALLYGMYKGKYNYKVLKYVLEFDDLPDAFDGYQITQISDVHSGSFDNIEKVAYGIDLINDQKSDVILFTGDMVNNKAEEMMPYTDLFSKLEAKDGKFSILGNHDYGDYASWESEAHKSQNLQDLKNMQFRMGFDLLLNENRFLERNGERLALIGVENWGKGGFKKAGDLEKAAAGVASTDFRILMSHDPSHWEEKVIHDENHYHLTLSGHTHGMQFGVEIPGWFKWSPVKWRYTYWAGIYKELNQYINVNRGFGFIGYPGRFGIWPEISVIVLKQKGTV